MSQSFDKLKKLLPELKQSTPSTDHEKFYKDEVLRFYSIGGTIEASFKNIENCIDERIISHILIRSVIENFFRLLFIYEDPNKAATNFDLVLNGFKKEYAKLLKEPELLFKDQLEPAESSWSSSSPPLKSYNLKDTLARVRNVHGDKLDYLYFIYRISSFDTHGNSLNSLFEASFNKTCNFPVLKIDLILEIISDEYLVIYSNQIAQPSL